MERRRERGKERVLAPERIGFLLSQNGQGMEHGEVHREQKRQKRDLENNRVQNDKFKTIKFDSDSDNFTKLLRAGGEYLGARRR